MPQTIASTVLAENLRIRNSGFRGPWLAQSVECAIQSWGHDFKPHVGCRDYFKNKTKQNSGPLFETDLQITLCL